MKHLNFWLAFVNLIYCIATFLFIIIFGSNKSIDMIIINKGWLFALVPLLINLAFIFVIFYNKLLGDDENH